MTRTTGAFEAKTYVTLDHGDVGSQTPTLVRLARAHHLTAYDAAYLIAAERVGVSLFDA
jgi:predicted nucleic acid-binding protein